MNKGLCTLTITLALTGCSGSSNNTSQLKLVNHQGYAAYQIDEEPWIEIQNELSIPDTTDFESFSYVSVCTNNGEYSDIRISVLSADSLESKKNSENVIELGCDSPIPNPETKTSFTVTSSNPNISIEYLHFPNTNEYSESTDGNNTAITIGTIKRESVSSLFITGRSKSGEYYFHYNSQFHFQDNNTYTIDFFDHNSVQAIVDSNLDSTEYSYYRSLIFNNIWVPLSSFYTSNKHIRPPTDNYYSSSSVYSETWQTTHTQNDLTVSITKANNTIINRNPLPELTSDISSISVSYSTDKAVNIKQDLTPNRSSFLDISSATVISYYDFDNATIRYENNTFTQAEIDIPSPMDFYSLPNFPDEAKIDMSKIRFAGLFLQKDNNVEEYTAGHESFQIEKITYF